MKIHIAISDENGNYYEGNADLVKVKLDKKSTQKQITERKTPSNSIRQLYLSSFFKEEKNLSETSTELKSKGFNFKKGSIVMALKAADYLIKNGEKGNFRFIQKYPPQ